MTESWSPLFSRIVDSSLWSEPDYVVKVFITMLALKDRENVVRFSAYALGQRAHKTESEVLEALKILSSPDTRRLEPQPFEGRRIEKVEGGWLLLNGKFYDDLMRQMSQRAYKRRKEAEYRARRKGAPLGGSAILNEPGETTALRAEREADEPAEPQSP